MRFLYSKWFRFSPQVNFNISFTCAKKDGDAPEGKGKPWRHEEYLEGLSSNARVSYSELFIRDIPTVWQAGSSQDGGWKWPRILFSESNSFSHITLFIIWSIDVWGSMVFPL